MANYDRVTLGDIKQKLRERTGETFWSDEEYTDAINEAIRCWQLMSGEWTRNIDFPANAALLNTYDVPKQICSLQRVSHANVGLTMSALPEMDSGAPGWEGTSGTPTYWMPAGVNIVDLTPYPTSGTINFEGYEEAPIMYTNGDFINIGDEELSCLLGYALHYLSFKEGITESESTIPLLAKMVQAAGRRNSNFRALASYKRYMGIYREAVERPSEVGEPKPGIRS